jgi:glutaminase
MVNPGALAVVSLAPGDTAEAKWQFILAGLSRFAGRPLALNDEVFASAPASSGRNQAISCLLHDYGRLYFDPATTTDVYTHQSCLEVTAQELAVMAATSEQLGMNLFTSQPEQAAQR